MYASMPEIGNPVCIATILNTSTASRILKNKQKFNRPNVPPLKTNPALNFHIKIPTQPNPSYPVPKIILHSLPSQRKQNSFRNRLHAYKEHRSVGLYLVPNWPISELSIKKGILKLCEIGRLLIIVLEVQSS